MKETNIVRAQLPEASVCKWENCLFVSGRTKVK